MSRRSAARNIAIGALALVVIGAPFLPDGADTDGALDPASVPGDRLLRATAERGRVTLAMQREIDAVLAQGRTPSRAGSAGPDLVTDEVRCADLEGQRYCLHTGWTTQPEPEVRSEVTGQVRALAARRQQVEETGDRDVLATLRAHAALPPAAQAQAERAELVEAARSVAKVWLLRHQIQGVPLPDGFLQRHPEIILPASSPEQAATEQATTNSNGDAEISLAAARVQSTGSASPAPVAGTAETAETTGAAYPERYALLSTRRVAEQTRSYWCGPASMQMLEWNWNGTQQSQTFWAGKLGTTGEGTSITQMVRVTNAYTGWDRADRAGTYVTLDIGDWSYSQWWLLQMRHYADYRAPIILHPVLRKEFYPYLDDDASGHFQVGRGYDKNGANANSISYFEPWNQQRFDPSEPYIARVQWRSAYRSYRANQAHFQHNLGV